MAIRRSGFTLVELLVVVGILAVLSALLFPVFAQAKAKAKGTACIAHFRSVSQAATIYAIDYSDVWMPVNHQPATTPNSRNDRTWVQMVLPYVRSFSVFHCPSDGTDRPRPESTFDQDLIPGDLFSRYYTASLRVNAGYNFQNFSPIVRTNQSWQARPRQASSISEPSRLVMFVDSVWDVHNGQPQGGGSWLVVPPCRFEQVGSTVIDTFAWAAGVAANGSNAAPLTEVFSPIEGWDGDQHSADPHYGGAWPWHGERATVAMADGSARGLTMAQLGEGCEIKPRWQGRIFDPARYRWFSR